MAGGRLWTREERLLIARSVALGETPAQTVEAYNARWPNKRGEPAIASQRSHPAVLTLVRQIVDAGLAAVAPTDSADPLVADSPARRLKSSWDPASGELVILKPRDGTWSRPSDLLDRAGIAWEEGPQGEPQPIDWIVKGIDLNEWATAMRLPDGSPASVPNWQAKLRLAPRPDAPILRAMERILERLGDEAPQPMPRTYKPSQDGHLLELVMPDLHFGNLAHRSETGEDSDTRLVSQRMLGAAESIISRADSQYPISEWVFVVGNDLLNADNEQGTTTAGTRQDVDSRKHKVLDQVMVAMTTVIDRLLAIAPGYVYCVPGNHDEESSQAVARFLAAWYRQTDAVTVDTSPRSRKYHRFGTVGLGYTHGHMENPRDLPIIMADEAPWWGETRIREWHLGHVHKAKEYQTLTTDETRGVRVRHLSSLAGLNAWHAKKGYSALKQADGFVWHGELGLRTIIVEQPLS